MIAGFTEKLYIAYSRGRYGELSPRSGSTGYIDTAMTDIWSIAENLNGSVWTQSGRLGVSYISDG
jgi:hypothetical protein